MNTKTKSDEFLISHGQSIKKTKTEKILGKGPFQWVGWNTSNKSFLIFTTLFYWINEHIFWQFYNHYTWINHFKIVLTSLLSSTTGYYQLFPVLTYSSLYLINKLTDRVSWSKLFDEYRSIKVNWFGFLLSYDTTATKIDILAFK